MRDRLLTVKQVATAIGRSDCTVYRMIDSGAIKSVRFIKRYRIRESELINYLNRQKEERTQK